MIEPGIILPHPIRRRIAAALLTALGSLALAPGPAFGQTTELVRSYQGYETAKAANKVDDALKFGDRALELTEAGGDRPTVVELLCNLGEFAGQAGRTQAAIAYYERALRQRSADLGADHPDLVPILTALAGLEVEAGKYADAATHEERALAIEKAVYGPHHENVAVTLRKLKAIYAASGAAAEAARVDAELASLQSTDRALPPPPRDARQRYKQHDGFATVKVFYGTNRAPSGEVKPALYYGKARGDLQYGYVNVTIPEIHQEAELETEPAWMELTIGIDRSALRRRYVVLDQVAPLSKEAFVAALEQHVSASPSRDLFVFVHGFNVTFEDAARRVAQMAYDLDFDGTPVLYSWPSQGSATAYTIDEAAVMVSGRKMADFLETIVASSGARRIHLLAHSMGNRALLEALQTFLAKRAPDQRQHLFGQIVLTAPDVDRDYFVDAMDSLKNSAERVTLYASSNDYALRTSQLLHGAPRAGTAGDVIVRLAGLDTIDMSSVPADLLGHSYYAANSGAIYDIFRLLWLGEAPPKRCGMSDRKGATGLTVWWFNADPCKGGDLLEAGVMLKRFGALARNQVVANIAALTDPSQKHEWNQILDRLNGLLAQPAVGGAK
jgi:esterase/lipase superfamily enzyme